MRGGRLRRDLTASSNGRRIQPMNGTLLAGVVLALAPQDASTSDTDELLQGGPPLLVVGQTIQGDITDEHPEVHTPKLDANFAEAPTLGQRFRVQIETPGTHHIDLRSWLCDTYLVLRDADGELLAENDDGPISLHSSLVVVLEDDRDYVIEAGALHGMRGAFEISLTAGSPQTLAGDELASARREDHARRIEAVLSRLGATNPEAGRRLARFGEIVYYNFGAETALPYLQPALEILDGVADAHSDMAKARHYFGLALKNLDRYAEVPEQLETALRLSTAASLLVEQGDYEAARPLYERVLAIHEQIYGPEDIWTASDLSELAQLAFLQGDYTTARPLYERALAIHEQVYGPEHPETTQSLHNLGVVLKLQGDYDGSRTYLERALDIRKRTLGPDHPDTAATTYDLAGLLARTGDYDAARALFELAYDIRKRTLRPDHPDTTDCLSSLGGLLRQQGDYTAAQPLLERALEIQERDFGDHPRTAACIDSLALLFLELGDYDEARQLSERALAICERTLGPRHPHTAQCLHDLARAMEHQGDYDAARPLYERALATYEDVLGVEHPDFGTALHNLALLLMVSGDYDAARPLAVRALEITEHARGPDHPYTASSLGALAVIHRRQGDLDAALPLAQRALDIDERVLGRAHPSTVHRLYALAVLLLDMDRVARARELLDSTRLERERRDRRLLATFSEAERCLFLARLGADREIELAVAEHLDSESGSSRAYDSFLAWKGQVARFVFSTRERLASDLTPEEREVVEELQGIQRRLSSLVFATDVGDPAMHAELLREAREERNRLEVELVRSHREEDGPEATVTFAELSAALPEGGAVLDFHVHEPYRPARWEDGELVEPGRFSDPRVSVWITRPTSDEPLRLDLGPAPALEAAVRGFLEDLVARRGIGVVVGAGNDPGSRLRALLWDPLAPHLEGVGLVVVSPDGFLGTLPLETIPLKNGTVLLEHHRFVYVQDASWLARRGETSGAPLDSLLAVGGVDFRSRGELQEQEPSDLVALTSPVRGRFTDYWGSLPATQYESQVVFDLHEDEFAEGERQLLQGDAPTEERLKRELQRHSVVHLATHGFFNPAGIPSLWDAARAAAEKERAVVAAEERHLAGKLPGLLSGLVCAGANRPEEGREDGYLTAEEVSWLDLSKVELVVLSACDTGLGRAQSGEGLIGLRRAFRTSGAETVISSLWSVKDESTAELMRDFYRNLFAQGMGRLEALHSAQLDMLDRNRREHGHALPSTWGAFVLSGEWR
jgi:tetratricopeptide (TPR) repeat protein